MSRKWLLRSLIIMALSGCQFLPGFLPTVPSPVSPALFPTSSPPATQPPPKPTEPPTPSPVPVGPWIINPKNIEENSAKPVYTLKLSYPVIAGTNDPHLLAFNQAAEKLAQDVSGGFRKDFQSVPSDPNFGPSFAQMTYSVTNGTHGLLSILFKVAFNASGAAHPNQYSLQLNFDLTRGKKLELSNLFLPNIDYLKIIADACKADLTKQNRLEFQEGVLPKADNFKTWNISVQGILFSFDPYQVASYAMGPSQVLIPYSALKGSIDPNGLLAPLLK
jgi:hypothetical protein